MSKLLEVIEDPIRIFLLEVVERACANFATLLETTVDNVSEDIIQAKYPSLGIVGADLRLVLSSASADHKTSEELVGRSTTPPRPPMSRI